MDHCYSLSPPASPFGAVSTPRLLYRPSRRLAALAACLFAAAIILPLGAEEAPPQVLDEEGVLAAGDWLDGTTPRRMLYDWLAVEVGEALDRRLERVEGLFEDAEVEAYQIEMREFFVSSLGGFPDRSPLEARTVGVVEGEGYRIERVLYHSQPGFPVSANLYLPEGEGPFPGVLHSCGHSADGKAAARYQEASALLARHGIAVLCVDPIGQGERKQLGAHGVTGSTTEHMLMGVAPVLLGRNLATHMIWDGIRGLDYLAERPEIDPTRLGAMGNSGGGMMTSYLMALDPRVVAAAPACFVTDTRRKNVRPGPGDAEQNLHGQTAYGLDHADFLLMRAPRPTLILSATQDYVPIEGAWESFRQAKRLYTRLGLPEGVDLVEDNVPHGFSPALQQGALRWMARWLQGRDERLEAPGVFEPLPEEALHAAPGGSVLALEGARSFFDLQAAEQAALAEGRSASWDLAKRDAAAQAERLAEVRALVGLPGSDELAAAEFRAAGEVEHAGRLWEKRLCRPEPGIVLPALVARPEGEVRGAVLWIDGAGKDAVHGEAETVADWLERGLLVCAVDLRGYGETASVPWRYRATTEAMGLNSPEAFIAYMLGRSFVGLRAADLLRTAAALAEELPGEAPVHLVARGHAAVPALHAAALERERFARVDLAGGLESWVSLCDGPVMDGWQLENAVHGALRAYDLPDLLGVLERGR